MSASNGKGHGMHSPFVFEFIQKVLNDRTNYAAYAAVENCRQQLLNDQTILEVEDFGAGTSSGKGKQRSVASIAKNAAKPAKFGQLLYRIVKYYQPQTILELGTSLGITTAYLSLARPESKLVTMEGAQAIAAKARQNFASLHLQNVLLAEGNFDQSLPTVLDQLPSLDLVFVDGNHRREPTVAYFNHLLARTHNNSILIFDDIHWSLEMEQAWSTIQRHPSVRCSIDLFFIGIVLFRQEFMEKQDFIIRF